MGLGSRVCGRRGRAGLGEEQQEETWNRSHVEGEAGDPSPDQ